MHEIKWCIEGIGDGVTGLDEHRAATGAAPHHAESKLFGHGQMHFVRS